MARLLKRKATEDSEGSQEHAKISSNSENRKNGPKEPPRASLLNPQSVVKILVGEEAKEFFVHKEVLCRYSPYFAGALREGGFQEAVTQSITLDHTRTETFGAFVYWIYAQNIEVTISTDPKETAEGMREKSWSLLVNLWILADYLQVPLLQNLVIKLIHEKEARAHGVPVSRRVYEQTLPGSMLQRLFIDFCVWRECGPRFYDSPAIPEAAFRYITIAFAKKCQTPTPPNPLDDVRNYYVKTE